MNIHRLNLPAIPQHRARCAESGLLMRVLAIVTLVLACVGCERETPAESADAYGPADAAPDIVSVAPAPASSQVREPGTVAPAGKQLYATHCGLCHQFDGSGVPGMHPPLAGSDVATGPAQPLIELTLRGVGMGHDSLPSTVESGAMMPAFKHVSDEELAAVLTYIRSAWGHDAEPVSAEDVQQVRDALNP